jgi:aspartate/methionine/tyrosine aminotransferase
MSPLPSSRFPTSLEPNPLTLAVRRARASGRRLLDLTLTNPTRAGFEYPVELLLSLSSREAMTYDPDPFGLPSARRAIAADYFRRGTHANPERIVLTASTSEAYAWCFKLLCRPVDDAVLVPTPSYPLFDHLTRLEGVRSLPYRLEQHGAWAIDFESIEEAWSDDEVRAVLAVSPNNPTGSCLTSAELATLGERCAYNAAALIVDEVFADYPLARPSLEPLDMPADCLTFRLGGLSKSAGLPQVKLAWMAVSGPDAIVARAMAEMELIADTYLSVSTPVQVAAEALIAAGADIRAQILERVRRNDAALRALAANRQSIQILRADAGWSVVLRVPSTRPEEDVAITLLEEEDVLVHPGFFFDFESECYLVVSLLPEPETFDEGVRRILERTDA